MQRVIIRPARREDAEALHAHCYPEACAEDVRDYLTWCLRASQQGRIVRLVAEVNGQVVGNAQLTVWGDEGEIGSLFVAEAYRQQGLARRMLKALIHEARQRGLAALEIAASERQPHILAFYRQMGFHPVENTKKELSRFASPEPIVLQRMHL